ncbi:hypothetical protein K2P56_03575 [Patescibacteria group bacterium]|nr:hypothetical protein [Patescibacteria group bacterium]
MSAAQSHERGVLSGDVFRIPPPMSGHKTCAEDDCTMLAREGDYCGGAVCLTLMGAQVFSRLH